MWAMLPWRTKMRTQELRKHPRKVKVCPWCGCYPIAKFVKVDGDTFTRIGCNNSCCPANPRVAAENLMAAKRIWNCRDAWTSRPRSS